jgi:hypothetical protein
MECILAEMKVSQKEMMAKMGAKMKADMKTETKNNQERLEVGLQMIKAKVEACLEKMEVYPVKMQASQEKLEATDLEVNPEEKEAIAEQQKVTNKQTAVVTIAVPIWRPATSHGIPEHMETSNHRQYCMQNPLRTGVQEGTLGWGAPETQQWHKGPRPERAATTGKQGKYVNVALRPIFPQG